MTNHITPEPVLGGLSFAQVSAGSEYTCSVTTSGAAYCWGLNVHGQLGDGSLNSQSRPVPVLGTLIFDQVGTGFDTTCGVTSGGAAYCWGDNSYGELGDPNSFLDARSSPTAVYLGLTFVEVSAGAWSSCGVTTDGSAYCWGRNEFGQLGDGTQETRLVPVRVLQ